MSLDRIMRSKSCFDALIERFLDIRIPCFGEDFFAWLHLEMYSTSYAEGFKYCAYSSVSQSTWIHSDKI